MVTAQPTESPGDNSKWVPPDSISNSEVKPLSADDSVGFPHVKVGHRRGIKKSERPPVLGGLFAFRDRRMTYLHMANHVPKLSGTILHCAGLTQPRRGCEQNAWNKVGHHRGVTKSERPSCFCMAF